MFWMKSIANAAVAFAICALVHGDTIGSLIAGLIAVVGYTLLAVTREGR